MFICRASKSGAADSWPSSDDDDELDLSPKVSVVLCIKTVLNNVILIENIVILG